MRRRGFFWTFLLALGVFGVVCFMVARFTRNDYSVRPTSLSSEPGGASALAELLMEAGVEVKRLYRPIMRPEDNIGMVLLFESPQVWWDVFSMGIDQTSEFDDVPVVLRATVGDEVPSGTGRYRQKVQVKAMFPAFEKVRELDVPWDPDMEALGPGWPKNVLAGESVDPDIIAVRSTLDDPLVTISLTEGQTIINVWEGSIFLNSLLGNADNAELLVSLIKAQLPEGTALGLPEYRYGVASPDNVYTRLGPAASAFMLQLVFVFFLIAIGVNLRFGLPPTDRPVRPGTGDFVSALGNALMRGHATEILLDTELRLLVRKAARKLNLSASLTFEERLERIPGDAGREIRAIAAAAKGRPGRREALAHLKKLRALAPQFDSDHRA
ncbi:MAG: hypothetical protein HND42_02300 [Armatimonadetes bacterium]|nr:hypothetical protein [Armatimonadota bacterium]NOG92058.1 hypothetical protein [Armatimonadota bacterium]